MIYSPGMVLIMRYSVSLTFCMSSEKMCAILHYNYYNRFTALRILSGTTQVSRYQKGKTYLDLLDQEIVSGSSISWAICKSAPHPDR